VVVNPYHLQLHKYIATFRQECTKYFRKTIYSSRFKVNILSPRANYAKVSAGLLSGFRVVRSWHVNKDSNSVDAFHKSRDSRRTTRASPASSQTSWKPIPLSLRKERCQNPKQDLLQSRGCSSSVSHQRQRYQRVALYWQLATICTGEPFLTWVVHGHV